MPIDSIESVYYVLAFLVPGFIADGVLSSFQTRKSERPEAVILRLFTLSVFNYALWSWLVYFLILGTWFKEHEIWAAVAWSWIILGGPVAIAVGLGFISQKGLARRVFQSLGLRTKHITPTAWDWKFEQQEPAWVYVTLKDGSAIMGLFGYNSFASSNPGERDLYIEQIYLIGDDGTWREGAEGKGILITGGEIKTIEFWPAYATQEQ